MVKIQTLEKSRWNVKQRLTERYRYFNQVPLHNSDDALMANWCEVTILNAKQEMVYRNAWATSHSRRTLCDRDGRRGPRPLLNRERKNNVLKNHGYHFEHNFAHGKQQLSNFLAFLKSAPTFDVRMECSALLWGTL